MGVIGFSLAQLLHSLTLCIMYYGWCAMELYHAYFTKLSITNEQQSGTFYGSISSWLPHPVIQKSQAVLFQSSTTWALTCNTRRFFFRRRQHWGSFPHFFWRASASKCWLRWVCKPPWKDWYIYSCNLLCISILILILTYTQTFLLMNMAIIMIVYHPFKALLP